MRRKTTEQVLNSHWSCTTTPVDPADRVGDASEPSPEEETEGTLFALARVVEQRDEHTAGHCERLALIGVSLGFSMGLDTASLLALYRGGYLHDIGKVGIPDSILFKPGRLTAEEWAIMRSHALRGEDICRHVRSLKPVLPIIRHHHERFDGTGYPDGLAGDAIPLLARITQIADIYDALISARPYKGAFGVDEALKTMEIETARGWRDPEIMKLFLQLHKDVITKITEYAVGPQRGLLQMADSLSGMRHFLAYATA